jgi:hypothetical protein
MRLMLFTALVRWTMSSAEYDRRCRRYSAGYGFRWCWRDWFTA